MNRELATSYLGLKLNSPVIVGACPLTMQPETVRQLIDAGAGAIVMPSMLQEQICHEKIGQSNPIDAIEQSGYQPQHDRYNGGTATYLETLENMKSKYAIPIIASMNGSRVGDWVDYALQIESAGADALELNWQPGLPAPDDLADQVEERLCELVREVTSIVQIPVAVKLNQRFTNVASIARKLQHASASGLVLFTHLPQWDVSIERLHWTVRWELSPVDSLGAILEGIVRARMGCPSISIAASGGIRTCEDALKTMIAGADVAMVTSEIYRSGPDAVANMIAGLHRYIQRSQYATLKEFQDARPLPEVARDDSMRLEYVDPLTRSDHYFDPTPVASTVNGDAFGHKS